MVARLPPTGIGRGHAAAAAVDPGDLAVGGCHPDRGRVDGQRGRTRVEPDRRREGGAGERIVVADRGAVLAGHPQAVRVGGERDRLGGHADRLADGCPTRHRCGRSCCRSRWPPTARRRPRRWRSGRCRPRWSGRRARSPMLIRDTVRSPLLATQTEPSVTAMPLGDRPTSMMRTATERLARSICETVSAPVLVTQARAPADGDAARAGADRDLADDLVARRVDDADRVLGSRSRGPPAATAWRGAGHRSRGRPRARARSRPRGAVGAARSGEPGAPDGRRTSFAWRSPGRPCRRSSVPARSTA